jgi:hypothetical protein
VPDYRNRQSGRAKVRVGAAFWAFLTKSLSIIYLIYNAYLPTYLPIYPSSNTSNTSNKPPTYGLIDCGVFTRSFACLKVKQTSQTSKSD